MQYVAQILGFGAIGLGLLLAVLAYRLVREGGVRERPLYVFMTFCLALIGIGAWLQYEEGAARNKLASLEDEHRTKMREFSSMQVSLAQVQDQVAKGISMVDQCRGVSSTLEAQSKAMFSGMGAIKASLVSVPAALQAVNAHVTDGQVCPGDKNGRPLPGASADSKNLLDVVASTNAAIATASRFSP